MIKVRIKGGYVHTSFDHIGSVYARRMSTFHNRRLPYLYNCLILHDEHIYHPTNLSELFVPSDE